jgi:hypothetical protein
MLICLEKERFKRLFNSFILGFNCTSPNVVSNGTDDGSEN